MSTRAANPFDPRVVLGLLLFGAMVFVGLLYFLGKGMTGDEPERGGSHVAGTGLDGYAAFARYLQERNFAVSRLRSTATFNQPGLLVLTPPHFIDGEELNRIVLQRRHIGPTLIVAPKWRSFPARLLNPAAKPGWVLLAGAWTPDWPGFHDEIGVSVTRMQPAGKPPTWHAAGIEGTLPNGEFVLSGVSNTIVPLVRGSDGRVLAGFLRDVGYYPALADLAEREERAYDGDSSEFHPLIFVFEPDLLNNYGFAHANNARMAERIVRAALDGSNNRAVQFDLTLNGYGATTNLLTLAFKPPFLAATLSLILAALAVGWRAFNRFGPPRVALRAIAFGKRALVGNAAGLVRRTRRLHLIGAPYADAARERLARALALPARGDAEATEAAIDRALAARNAAATPFTEIAFRLRAGRRPAELLHAARELHALERTLTR